MYRPHVAYPFLPGWALGFLPLLVNVNNAAVNIGVQISVSASSFKFWGIYT